MKRCTEESFYNIHHRWNEYYRSIVGKESINFSLLLRSVNSHNRDSGWTITHPQQRRPPWTMSVPPGILQRYWFGDGGMKWTMRCMRRRQTRRRMRGRHWGCYHMWHFMNIGTHTSQHRGKDHVAVDNPCLYNVTANVPRLMRDCLPMPCLPMPCMWLATSYTSIRLAGASPDSPSSAV